MEKIAGCGNEGQNMRKIKENRRKQFFVYSVEQVRIQLFGRACYQCDGYSMHGTNLMIKMQFYKFLTIAVPRKHQRRSWKGRETVNDRSEKDG